MHRKSGDVQDPPVLCAAGLRATRTAQHVPSISHVRRMLAQHPEHGHMHPYSAEGVVIS